MRAGVPRETRRSEARVAATPETVVALVSRGFDVVVEHGAGEGARIPDAAYTDAGARLVDGATVWTTSDLLLKVARPTRREIRSLKEGATLASLFDGDETDPMLEALARRRATYLAVDHAPRIRRAQGMDLRSSMAGLVGYRAVVEAASHLGRPVGPQVTAAGHTPPATVLILGTGVAGLAALATARSLGARVRAFDPRAACRAQVESLGGTFLEVDPDASGERADGDGLAVSETSRTAERALLHAQAPEVDVVITTAPDGGHQAPVMWQADMVAAMRPGGVVVDLAASRGGHCALTEPGQVIEAHGVTIVGATDLTQPMAEHASRLLARHLLALVDAFGPAEAWHHDMTDDVIRCVTVLKDGERCWPAAPPPSSTPPVAAPPCDDHAADTSSATGPLARPAPTGPAAPRVPGEPPSRLWMALTFAGVLALAAIAQLAPPSFLHHLTVFVLACFIGWQVVWNVPPALHTPLMGITNALCGILVVGGILQLAATSGVASVLAFLAVGLAAINLFGGFAVTHRMLVMFRREDAR